MGIASVAPILMKYEKIVKCSLAMTRCRFAVKISKHVGIEFVFGQNGASAVAILAMTPFYSVVDAWKRPVGIEFIH
jgi:hypothetical protein